MAFKANYIPISLVELDVIDDSGYVWWLLYLAFESAKSRRRRLRREIIPVPIGPCHYLKKVRQ